jgi:hypothetical protein
MTPKMTSARAAPIIWKRNAPRALTPNRDGDRDWRNLLAEHYAMVRRELARYRGVELDTAGDGFFARLQGIPGEWRLYAGVLA